MRTRFTGRLDAQTIWACASRFSIGDPRGDMTTINQNKFKPFLSASFLEAQGRGKVDAALVKALLAEVETLISSVATPPSRSSSPVRSVVEVSVVSKQNKLHVATLVYKQKGSPNWLAAGQLEDVTHHLIVIAVLDKLVALIASDAAIRDTLARNLNSATLLSGSRVADAFVGPEAKTLWLSGVHASTSVKVDSKALTGTALENALDPIGDQSYALSAIRSQPSIAGLGSGKLPVVVGAAPSASRIWLGRPSDWSNFLDQMQIVLEHLKKSHTPTTLYGFLSQPVSSLSTVKGAYGIAVLPSAMLVEDAGMSDEDRREASRWVYEATYVVTPLSGADFSVDVSLDSDTVGRIQVTVTMGANGKVSLATKWTTQGSAPDEDRDACRKFLSDPEQLKAYYDSGHAITNSKCYLAGWTDHLLDWDFQDLNGYNLWQEKPAVPKGKQLAEVIDSPVPGGPSSLFTFVQQVLFRTGWLACDDGAMELADFVHLEPSTGRITLIHVKGAGSKKKSFTEVSVSDYEVVVSQGVKNIRFLTPEKLADALEAGSGKNIAKAVWLDQKKQTDRAAMIMAIRALPPSAPRTLLILQPRLKKKEYDHCRGRPASAAARVMRFKQLNALMLAARVAAMGAGAEFRAIAVK